MLRRQSQCLTEVRLMESGSALPVPATLGELRVAFNQAGINVLQLRRGQAQSAPVVQVNQRDLDILVASILRHTVAPVSLVEQCGRFLLVDYTPIHRPCPQMVIAWMPGAQAFHEAMMGFQRARADKYSPEGAWYDSCMEAARKVLGPLSRLQPRVQEADFVIGWLLHTVATGQRIY